LSILSDMNCPIGYNSPLLYPTLPCFHIQENCLKRKCPLLEEHYAIIDRNLAILSCVNPDCASIIDDTEKVHFYFHTYPQIKQHNWKNIPYGKIFLPYLSSNKTAQLKKHSIWKNISTIAIEMHFFGYYPLL